MTPTSKATNAEGTYIPFDVSAMRASHMVAEERHDLPRDLHQTNESPITNPDYQLASSENVSNDAHQPGELSADLLLLLTEALDDFDEPRETGAHMAPIIQITTLEQRTSTPPASTEAIQTTNQPNQHVPVSAIRAPIRVDPVETRVALHELSKTHKIYYLNQHAIQPKNALAIFCNTGRPPGHFHPQIHKSGRGG